MKEALLYKKLKDQKVHCELCPHSCIIAPGKRGICMVRENRDGTLYSLVYGKAVAINIDPIEKKPLYHFLPGSFAYSLGTVGCNLWCKFCQNDSIAHYPKEHQGEIIGKNFPSERIIQEALASGCQSIAYTYTEPSIFLEYALDIMKLAHKKGLKNIFITNGYMTAKTLKLLKKAGLDAANVDLKGFSEKYYQTICAAHLKPILDTLKLIKKLKIHVEVTSLIIPTLNDKEEEFKKIAGFISKELGTKTPWHISRFFPGYKLTNLPPTSPETLKKAYEIGKKSGLKFVYVGNMPDLDLENTICPQCQKTVIERHGYLTKIIAAKNGKCKFCNENLNIKP